MRPRRCGSLQRGGSDSRTQRSAARDATIIAVSAAPAAWGEDAGHRAGAVAALALPLSAGSPQRNIRPWSHGRGERLPVPLFAPLGVLLTVLGLAVAGIRRRFFERGAAATLDLRTHSVRRSLVVRV